MNDLGNSLVEALANSSEASDKLRRIQEAGYLLYLAVDCKRESEEGTDASRLALKSSPRGSVEPVFRINTDDLCFLRSIGIDPTRQHRSRRSG